MPTTLVLSVSLKVIALSPPRRLAASSAVLARLAPVTPAASLATLILVASSVKPALTSAAGVPVLAVPILSELPLLRVKV